MTERGPCHSSPFRDADQSPSSDADPSPSGRARRAAARRVLNAGRASPEADPPAPRVGAEIVTSLSEFAIDEQRLLWAVRIWVSSGRFCGGLTGVFQELGCAGALPPLQRLLMTIGQWATRTVWVRHVGCPAVNGDEAELIEALSLVRRGRHSLAGHRLRAILPLAQVPSALLSLRAVAEALPADRNPRAPAMPIPEPQSKTLH